MDPNKGLGLQGEKGGLAKTGGCHFYVPETLLCVNSDGYNSVKQEDGGPLGTQEAQTLTPKSPWQQHHRKVTGPQHLLRGWLCYVWETWRPLASLVKLILNITYVRPQ